MARKATFTKTQFVESAIRVVRKKGYESLSVRELSREMGSSTSPIFTLFGSFEALKAEVMKQIFDILNRYLSVAIDYTPIFKEYGRRLVYFAKEEPMLFRAIHMGNHSASFHINELESMCKTGIMDELNLSEEQATLLLDQVYIFADGLATEMAFGSKVISDDEINMRLGLAFRGTYLVVKQGLEQPLISPHRSESGEAKHIVKVSEDEFDK